MNAKQRRMEKRRMEKRHGLTEREFSRYQEKIRSGYSHVVALNSAKAGR